MKRNLYLVESPFQALCALEASLIHKDDINDVVYKLSGSEQRKRNDQQIIDIVNKGNWGLCKSYTVKADKGRYVESLRTMVLIQYLKRFSKQRVDRLYFGEFRCYWMHIARFFINPNETWLIDDGAASVVAVNDYILCKKFVPRPPNLGKYNLLKRLIQRVKFGVTERRLLVLEQAPIHVFSAFLPDKAEALDNGISQFKKNNFERVKRLYVPNPSQLQNKEVFYYGSKYSEAGILQQGYELAFIKAMADFYAQKGIAVRYFAHRDEQQNKLEKIKQLGLTVMVSPNMAELDLLQADSLPVEIASAYSTVLTSLNVLFPEIKKTSFVLDANQIAPIFRENISKAYQHIQNNGITMVIISTSDESN